MKYIKKFEYLQDDIAFSVGDIVVCIYKPFAEIGTKFRIEKISTVNNMKIINLNHLKESQHNKNYFVTVKNMEGNNTHSNIWSHRFVSETKYNEMKYNL
jgi:hypothetical protein